jgi:DNA processing protein
MLDTGGCFISEYKHRTPPYRGSFVERDTVQAQASLGVVLIQSDVRGGSLHACRAILKQRRYLFVAAPSRTDRENNESKIFANLRLLYGGINSAVELLGVDTQEAARIIPLLNRDALDHAESVMLTDLEMARARRKEHFAKGSTQQT